MYTLFAAFSPDEPCLQYRRNVFYPKSKEQQVIIFTLQHYKLLYRLNPHFKTLSVAYVLNNSYCITVKQVDDEVVLKLLYEEAKDNILTGRYPCDPEHWMTLGALSFALDKGTGLDSQQFTSTLR